MDSRQEMDVMRFDMGELRSNLPPQNRRGLSRCYSGKSQSFTCMADVHSIEDLKKQENPDVKKRKKYAHEHRPSIGAPPLPCRRVSSVNHCPALYVGV